MGAFIRCPMHLAARFERIRGAGSRPVWSCLAHRPRAGCRGDCGISAEVVTGGDIAQEDTVEILGSTWLCRRREREPPRGLSTACFGTLTRLSLQEHVVTEAIGFRAAKQVGSGTDSSRRDLLALIGTLAGSAAMYHAMSSLGFASDSAYKGPLSSAAMSEAPRC
jgi:hypothetical protein